MKVRTIWIVVAMVAVLALGACNKAEPMPEAAIVLPGGEAAGPGGSLQGATRLALGTLKLEGTEHAVTPEQAAEMLPLWKAIQGGSLQGAAETDAVLKQIEGKFDENQLAAIDEMELTFQEIGAWMQSPSAKALGIEMPARPEGQGAGPGGGAFQNMTEAQRNQFRREMQNMTPEQRATRLAEMGIERPQGGGQGGGQGGRPGGFGARRGGNFLVDPLVELLSERSAQ